MKTSFEKIEKEWMSICQPGNLIKRTSADGKSSFFLVCSVPTFKRFVDYHTGIELTGIWISRPNSIFLGKILTLPDKVEKQTIVCRDINTLSLATVDDIVACYKEEYQKEINDMFEEIKKIKEHIHIYKKTMKTLDSFVSNRYEQSLKL